MTPKEKAKHLVELKYYNMKNDFIDIFSEEFMFREIEIKKNNYEQRYKIYYEEA